MHCRQTLKACQGRRCLGTWHSPSRLAIELLRLNCGSSHIAPQVKLFCCGRQGFSDSTPSVASSNKVLLSEMTIVAFGEITRPHESKMSSPFTNCCRIVQNQPGAHSVSGGVPF